MHQTPLHMPPHLTPVGGVGQGLPAGAPGGVCADLGAGERGSGSVRVNISACTGWEAGGARVQAVAPSMHARRRRSLQNPSKPTVGAPMPGAGCLAFCWFCAGGPRREER